MCGFHSWGKETTPCPISGLPWDTFGGVWRGSNPLHKTSRIRWVPRTVPKVGFPRKTADNTGERNEAGESPDALCARPVTSTRSAGGFSGGFEWRCSLSLHSQMTLFPLEITILPIGKAFCQTLPGFSGHANDNIPIILPQWPGYSPALPVCCVVGRRRWAQPVRICAA